jgi:hypothetical protein
MSVYITDTLRLLESKLAATGRFSGGVQVGQPTAPPETPYAAIFLSSGTANLLTMTSYQRTREVTVRIYLDGTAEPRDEAEIELDQMVYDTEEDLRTDLSLGTAGWVITPGADVAESYDYLDVGGQPFRTADITIPLSYRA